MSLVNMTTGEPAPARQQLRQLNEMSRQELENSLLKEVLADYTEKWKIQQQEQSEFIRQQTEEIERLQALIQYQQSLNEQLSHTLREEGDRLIKEFQQRYSTAVTKEIADYTETAKGLTKELASQTTSYILDLNSLKYDIDQERKKMFTFTKLKSALFWFGCVTNLGTFLFLLVQYWLKV